MRNLKNIFYVLVAICWLPLSAHCQLEAIQGFEFLRCPVGHTSSNSGPTSKHNCGNCCSSEKSQYNPNQGHQTIPAPHLILNALVSTIETEQALAEEVSFGILKAASPEIPKSWHFILRTALPVRAPSLVS